MSAGGERGAAGARPRAAGGGGAPVRLGVVMDPIGGIKIAKDSTFAMLLAAQARGWELRYMELGDLWLEGAQARARMRPLAVRDDPHGWHELGDPEEAPLAALDVVLMRKDPPVDLEYLRATWILERAEAEGVLVVNAARALRNVDEKLWTAWFADLAPPFVVTREPARIEAFLEREGEIVLKPLGRMGGQGVFYLRRDDPNRPVVIETVTAHGRRFCMAQRFVPEIRTGGDHRILLVDGEPVPYALARVPRAGEVRGNLAAGGRAEGVALDARERAICARLGPVLRREGLLFVGIDVIGGWLTEINVTSPTCIRELDALYGLDIAGQLMEAIERRLARREEGRA